MSELNIMTNEERFLFGEGTYFHSYKKLGAHPACHNGKAGYNFAVWAPDIKSISVVGPFNNWNENECAMTSDKKDGVWHLFIPGLKAGELYKYSIETMQGERFLKADPYAFSAQLPPETASVPVGDEQYRWKDSKWLKTRKKGSAFEKPMNIYEVHLGSWKRHEDGTVYSYRELAETLVPYVVEMGYTHLELLPVMEHPFDGSWGYQLTGYYAPTSRYGSPEDFKYFIDICHQNGIAVVIDWVPGHFCRDAHGLGRFNGQKLYEMADHQQWGTYRFDLGRGEVGALQLHVVQQGLCDVAGGLAQSLGGGQSEGGGEVAVGGVLGDLHGSGLHVGFGQSAVSNGGTVSGHGQRSGLVLCVLDHVDHIVKPLLQI